jgi:hypothetical protein
MPDKHQRKPAPRPSAPIEEHRKHAEAFLKDERYKVKPEKLQDRSDEAKP